MFKQKYKHIKYVALAVVFMAVSVGVPLIDVGDVSAADPAKCAWRSSSGDNYTASLCSEAGYDGLEDGKYYRIDSLEMATEIALGNRQPQEISETAYIESVIDSCSPDDRRSDLECQGVTTREERTQQLARQDGSLNTNCRDGLDPDSCPIMGYLLTFINGLSALVGIVIVIMITIGGIQYSMARDNPQAVAAARQRIFNAVLALVLFFAMFAILQWLVPGGLFQGGSGG
ncbi:MAG: pilin [Candidatus Saccharibacteria bacterium]|nr:pilin [Candidatus Saccharibacteria bacterium]